MNLLQPKLITISCFSLASQPTSWNKDKHTYIKMSSKDTSSKGMGGGGGGSSGGNSQYNLFGT